MLDRRRILLIEDDGKTGTNLANLLSREYDVTIEARAEDAIEDVVCLPFDLVILDLDLVGLSGEEALIRIRNLPEHAEVPIIALSGCPELRLLLRGLNLQGFIDKPIVPQKLRDAIRRILTSNQMPFAGRRATDMGWEAVEW